VPFRDLAGQQHAHLLLQGALRSGRISHAYLFVGPAGVGRLTTACAFAQALLCAQGGDDACGVCGPCRKVAAGTHPDLRVITPGRTESGAERRAVAIDQIRDLKRDAAYPPYEGRWKIYVIEDTDQMRAEAANSLLKVLEEPTAGTVIILLSTSTEALLPTLVSRAQLVRFALVSAEEIVNALVSRAGIPIERARFLAAMARGRPAAAFEAAGAGDEPFARRLEVLTILRAVQRGDIVAGLDAAERVARQKDEIEGWLDIASLWFRDLAVWRMTQDPGLLANVDLRDDVARDAAAAGRVADLTQAVDAVEQAKDALRRNINPRLILETLFTRLGAVAGSPAR
jgi:DNA polymerase III subunit delta'